MGDPLAGIASLLAGGLLGWFFFGSLRWTVDQAMASEHTGPWFLGSLLLRMAVTLTGFYAVGQGHWERFALCMLGFLLAKTVVVGRSAPATPTEVADAP